jgi:hypothetical protein
MFGTFSLIRYFFTKKDGGTWQAKLAHDLARKIRGPWNSFIGKTLRLKPLR